MGRRRGKAMAAGVRNPRKPAESPAAEAVTASWMLAIVTAAGVQAAAIALRAVISWWPGQPRLEVLAGMLLFAAVVVGLALLALTALTLRLRRVSPPRVLVVAGILLGSVPVVTLLVHLAGS